MHPVIKQVKTEGTKRGTVTKIGKMLPPKFWAEAAGCTYIALMSNIQKGSFDECSLEVVKRAAGPRTFYTIEWPGLEKAKEIGAICVLRVSLQERQFLINEVCNTLDEEEIIIIDHEDIIVPEPTPEPEPEPTPVPVLESPAEIARNLSRPPHFDPLEMVNDSEMNLLAGRVDKLEGLVKKLILREFEAS